MKGGAISLTTKNIEIKTAAKQKGVFYYEIADRLGIVDSALSRKLLPRTVCRGKAAYFLADRRDRRRKRKRPPRVVTLKRSNREIH